MQVYVTTNEKGGTGKTTVAVNLAAHLAMDRRTLLIDTDTETNALAWVGERQKHALLPEIAGSYEPKRLIKIGREGYDAIVIDAGGGDSNVLREALRLADVAVVPFMPQQWDAWKATAIASRIARARAGADPNPRLRAIAVVNGVLPQPQYRHMGPEMQAALESAGQGVWTVARTIVHMRPLQYKRAASEGMGLHELGPYGAQAADELWSVFQEIEEVRAPKAAAGGEK